MRTANGIERPRLKRVREVGSKFDIRSSIFNVEMNMRMS